MVCDHKSLTVINNSFVFSSKIIRECFTGAENDSLYQSTVPLPRQKKLTPFRFPGFRKSQESSISVSSFFLSETEISRGISVSVLNGGSDLNCPGVPKGPAPQGSDVLVSVVPTAGRAAAGSFRRRRRAKPAA